MHRARAAMPGAAPDRPRIGLDQSEALERQTEQLCRDLRIARFVTLTIRLGAEDQRNPAICVEPDFGALVWRAARGLEKRADPEPPQPPARRPRFTSRREIRVPSPCQCIVEIGSK